VVAAEKTYTSELYSSRPIGCSTVSAEQLPSHQRAELLWHYVYVLLGETIVRDWHAKNARATELLDYARIRATSAQNQDRLL